MRKIIFGLMMLLSSASAFGSILTFDDVTMGGYASLGSYGGLNWTNTGVLQTASYVPSGYRGGTVSGDYVAFNEYAQTATVSSGTFTFNSAYLGAAWNNGLSVKVEGKLLGNLIYSTTVTMLNPSATLGASATLFTFNYSNIDELVFSSFGGTNAGFNGSGDHFAMDNMKINEPINATVPEPGSLAIWGLGVGLASMASVRRRKVRA